MADICISYARADLERVKALASALKAQGWSVWWDDEVRGGEVYAKDIQKALEEARVVIAVWSKSSIESNWVKDEAELGRDRGTLLPVSLDGAVPPLGFRQFQCTDLSHWNGEGPLPEKLIAAVATRLGVQAPTPTARPASQRRAGFAIAVAGAVAAAAIAVAIAWMVLVPGDDAKSPPHEDAAASDTAPAAPIASASIAVLPFTDLSAQRDQQHFSDGIAEELLNVLAKVDGLKVASRTSSFRFRDSDVGAPAIANELHVRHLLEGSVRKAGDTVRITAQLIDALDDRHLWSEVYERPLTAKNAFAIQEDIANAVVRELAARIGTDSKAVRVEADTANVTAYELYLKGRALFALRGSENLATSARELEKATSLDPRFARAWETLAMTYAVAESWGLTGRDYRRLALDAADRAERLDPALSSPYAVRGSVIFDMIGMGESDDWEASLSNLDDAIAHDPKNATAWFWRGMDLLVLGYFDRAIADYGRCVEIDPAYTYCSKWLAFAHLLGGREDEALLFYERSSAAVFSSEAAFAATYVGRGDLRAANSILTAQYADLPELARALFRAMTDPSFTRSDRRKALSLIDDKRPAIGRTAARFFLGDYSEVGKNINSGLWWYRGDKGYLKSSERKAHMRGLHLPEYWRTHGFPPQCRPVGAHDFECD